MAGPLRQSTATSVVIGPFLDSGDFLTSETALTVASIDVDLYKQADTHPRTKVDIAPAASGSANDMAHVANGYYSLELTGANTDTPGHLRLTANIAGALPVVEDFVVLPGTVYDSLVADTDRLQVDAREISGDQVAADNLESAADGTGYNLGGGGVVAASVAGAVGSVAGNVGGNVSGNVSGNVAGSVGSVAAGGITAASLAADALTAAKVAADVGAEIATAVRTELGTELGRVDVAVSSRLAAAGYTAPDNATITAIAGFVDTEVAAIKAKTDLIPAAPAAVGDVPTASANAAAVLAAVVENGRTVVQVLRGIFAAATGKSSGHSTNAPKYRDNADTKDRISATTTADGRTAVTLDLT